MKIGMTEKDFNIWKLSWLTRVPKCLEFACCHELMSCAIRPLCACGSIYTTYKSQLDPEECTNVGCQDCLKRYTCKRFLKKAIVY